ncbi:MAG TPA: SsrA-binding protein SmpB [bacterium]|nr:SsrA-binding protein SmpB [bacterium]
MKEKGNMKFVTRNKKAFFDYEILDRFEAGLVLRGSEIKSVRGGGVNIEEGYVRMKDGEAFLVQVRIAPYKQSGTYFNHDPFRQRKLLLHKREIESIAGRVQRRGLTVLPLSLYLKGNLAKVEIGLARSKKKYDKRMDIIKREQEKEAGREMKQRNRQ